MSTADKFKSGASSLFSKTKTGMARTKQKALVAMGKTEETVDVTHMQEIQRFNETHEIFKKISKDAYRLLEVLKELSVVQSNLAEDFYELYDVDSEMHEKSIKYQEVTKNIDHARSMFDEKIKNDLLEPISIYLGQYKEMKERLKDEEVRKVDMDRYNRDVKGAQEKAKSVGTVSNKEMKADGARANYDNLHNELAKDLPALFEDRVPFFNPAFATYMISLSEMFKEYAQTTSTMVPTVSHVNRSAIHHHPRVTTAPEQSHARVKTAAPAPGTAPTGSGSTYQQGPANPVPPSFQQQPATTNAATSQSNTGRAMPTAPTKPTPIPGPKEVRAKALYDFNAQESNELGFKAGDVITIVTQSGDWWTGEKNGQRGLLPSNYVQII
eukprot:TRINITY_DN1129_c0_g1_i1.p1 TRINITY_DN1129_c0_g1~~TRINITY_DN1129_c0_g1_i1.p1  ORF type:complete len:418 (-),score=106.83 TRINITY_DN1129_c0_g1_i1:111-1259(-)